MKTTLTNVIAKWQAGSYTDNELVKWLTVWGIRVVKRLYNDGFHCIEASIPNHDKPYLSPREFEIHPDMRDGYIVMLTGYPYEGDPLSVEMEA